MKAPLFGRIGVLAGGPSNEREISLRSGHAVHSALLKEGFDAIFLDIKDDIRKVLTESAIDVAFIALHGRFGEDGTVQRMLEEIRIPYTGSNVPASRLALDKIASKKVFIEKGIPVPDYAVLEKVDPDKTAAARLGYPLVVKPQFEGSSIGLSIVGKEESLADALDRAFGYGDKVMLEEYIKGRELTVGILSDKALPVIEIVTRSNVYDYEAKYKNADTQYLVPAPLDKKALEEAGRLGMAAHKALGCSSFSRVDMMMDDAGKFFVLEVNTIPGMTERSLLPKAAQAIGLPFGGLCVKILEDTIARTVK
jgi:D-alanine-D-alanine ligase